VKTDVEELGPTRVKLTIEVPFEELKGSLDKAYREVGRQVRVPGFRPGRVPPRIIDQRFGRGVVLEQAVNEAVPQLYGQALQDNDVFALGQPDLEITKLDDGKELAFTAEVDVRPKFEIPDLHGLPVTVDNAVVTPDEVEEYIGGLRERFASLKGVERPVEDGDFTSIDLSASVDGEPVEDAQVSGYSYQVGSGSLLDGLDEALTGLSAGEVDDVHRRAGRRGPRRRAGRGDRDRAQRQGQGASRAGRRVRPVGQRVRHARRVPRRDPRPAGEHEADAAGRPGARARAGGGAQQIDIPLPDSMVTSEIQMRHESLDEQLERAGTTMDDYLATSGQTAEQLETEITDKRAALGQGRVRAGPAGPGRKS